MANILIMNQRVIESKTLRVILEKSGHQVTEINDSTKGIEIIQSRVFDLIMYDITMQGTDGFKFLEIVPKALRKRTVIVSPETSIAPLGIIEQLARCKGAMGALKQPINSTELLQFVENISVL
ncbi:MAG: response regulator [Magnetococcales bacterium]|nr:response regulator [Magnetococcales bacterium]